MPEIYRQKSILSVIFCKKYTVDLNKYIRIIGSKMFILEVLNKLFLENEGEINNLKEEMCDGSKKMSLAEVKNIHNKLTYCEKLSEKILIEIGNI